MKQEHSNKMAALIARFIGSHLYDRLIMEGYNIVCLGILYAMCMGNIQYLLEDPIIHMRTVRSITIVA